MNMSIVRSEILRLENLCIAATSDEGAETAQIVKGVSLSLRRGEVVGLIGESGAGKSTIGLAALGYTRPGCSITDGRIFFAGLTFSSLVPSNGGNYAGAASLTWRRVLPHPLILQCDSIGKYVKGPFVTV